ncbi:hypothetical protein COHA_002198 [Chlorella ohadii]|uniref:Amine oxidase n=1 Tax=Chlorella ohadii TaxID=2649997 RepID=A0AAD5H4J7_9CHLO|nr:hypothetical protein COHA_002198 [Chlorella ohadii]
MFPQIKFPGEVPAAAGLGWTQAENENIKPTDTYIHKIIHLQPKKKEALAWLDGTGPMPARFAKVIVIRGASQPRDVMEYQVGPLCNGQVCNYAGILALTADGQIPYVKRPEDSTEYNNMDVPINAAATLLKQVFKDMSSSAYCYGESNGCDYDHFMWWNAPAYGLENGQNRISNVQWWFNPFGADGGNEYNLMPMPLFFRLDHTAASVAQWRVFDIVYCNQGPWPTAQSFLAAYNSNKVVKCAAPYGAQSKAQLAWSRTDVPRGSRVASSAAFAGPKTVWPEGPRFAVGDATSQTGRSFTWMGWSGHVSVNPYTGLQFFNLKFKGQRVVYELALKQELYAEYAGYGMAGQVVYFDSAFGIGAEGKNLRPGVDCPEGAVYFGVSALTRDMQVVHTPRVACMFEDDHGFSDWRHTHTADTTSHMDGVRSSAFVVRMVSTPGNYDYINSYMFRYDGSIEIDIKMGGYMSTSYWDPNRGTSKADAPYMVRVQQATAGVLHDHLALFKIDLDVLGTANKVVQKQVKYGDYKAAGNQAPGWGYTEGFKYIAETKVPKEAGFSWNYAVPSLFQVQSATQTNQWGLPRAYSFSISYTTSQLLPATHPLVKSQYWTTKHMWFTKHKDTEEHGHYSVYDFHNARTPLFSFQNYVNGENLDGEDVVVWAMIGAQHVPRSEDSPLITNMGTHMMIKPWNYHDELASMDIVDKFQYQATNPDLGNPATTRWVE